MLCKVIRPYRGLLCKLNLNSGVSESNICSMRRGGSDNFKRNGTVFVETNNSLFAKIIVN